MKKECLVTTITAGLVMYFGGFIIYGLLLMDVLATEHMKDPPVMWAIPLSSLLSGAVVATVLSWRSVNEVVEGVKTGAIMGALLSLSYGVMFYASLDLGTTAAQIGIDCVASTVLWGATGGAVGWVRGKIT